MWNQIKTIFLLGAMTALVLAVGTLFGTGGIYLAAFFAIMINFVSYFWSDKIVLASYRAKEVERGEHEKLYAVVRRVAQRADMPMPRVYILPGKSPNAFATGRNPKHAAIAYTQGILELLTDEELEGVTAHEMAHIKNRDILIGSITAMFASIIGYLAYLGLFLGGDDDNPFGTLLAIIIAPIVATLVQLAISRTREFSADATGAQLTRKPQALASALKRLHTGIAAKPMRVNEGSAFMFIANPLGRRMMRFLSTHPPMEERIRRLEGMRL